MPNNPQSAHNQRRAKSKAKLENLLHAQMDLDLRSCHSRPTAHAESPTQHAFERLGQNRLMGVSFADHGCFGVVRGEEKETAGYLVVFYQFDAVGPLACAYFKILRF